MDIPKEALTDDLKALGENILSIMQDNVKDLWRIEDTEFLKQLAQDVAKQKMAAVKEKDPSKKKEYEQNLLHLANTIQLEIVNKRLQIRAFRKDVFARVLQAVIKTVAATALEIAKSQI